MTVLSSDSIVLVLISDPLLWSPEQTDTILYMCVCSDVTLTVSLVF